jgi:hypothetical protein
MNRDWSTFNVKYFAIPMTMLVFGMVIGFGICNSKKKPIKIHPIEVRCVVQTDGWSNFPTMDADSVKGDTIYKNGISIVNKNILNIQFK